jgi:hypothetical protein
MIRRSSPLTTAQRVRAVEPRVNRALANAVELAAIVTENLPPQWEHLLDREAYAPTFVSVSAIVVRIRTLER